MPPPFSRRPGAVGLLLVMAATFVTGSAIFHDRDDVICKGKKVGRLKTSKSLCEDACAERSDCFGYSFLEKSDPNKGKCFLYDSCDITWYKDDWESAVKWVKPPNDYNQYEGVECTGTSILSTGDAETWEECQLLCDEDPICHSYSFKRDGERCYLKDDCDERVENTEEGFHSGVNKYHDKFATIEDPECPDPSATCSPPAKERCPEYTESSYETSDLEPGTFTPPYQDVIDGETNFNATYPEVTDYPTCPFKPPNDPYPKKWFKQCIKNLRRTGLKEDVYARPNIECPAGFFLCRGMCYTIVQRNSRGPEAGWSNDFYAPDYMGVEARCGTCGGARVAFLGEEGNFKKVVAQVAAATRNDDRATWVRRYRFRTEPSQISEFGQDPYQPWHRYVTMIHEDPVTMTYQRYYTGEKDEDDFPDGLPKHGTYDIKFRNQEGSILCVNTLERIQAAVRTINSGMSMEEGCFGEDEDDKWDDDKHRWFPEHHWPYPGH